MGDRCRFLIEYKCMSFKSIIQIVFFAFPFQIQGQISGFIPDSSYVDYWCSIEILGETNQTIDDLSLIQVAFFLATFHKDCEKNIEYSEWSNELLFEVLNRQPEYFLQLLSKNDSLDKALILENLKSPINDKLNIHNLIDNLSKIQDYAQVKLEVINALTRA